MPVPEMPAWRIGQRLKAAREKRGWSQQDLALRAGITLRQVQWVERGKYDHRALAAILRVLDLTEVMDD